MTDNPIKLWEELKRRKVVRVAIGYAAAAYVILELISIISEPFGLPGWTLKLVFVLLCVGFIFSIYLSWVFDITPKGIQKTESAKGVKGKPQPEPVKRKLRVSDAIIGVLLVAVVILAYPKIFKKDKFSDIRDSSGRISVAVMPFENMTNDTLWNIWQEGIQYALINDLTNAPKELIVRQFQTVNDLLQGTNRTNYASISPSIASDLSKKLNVNTFITGNIVESGDRFRINAQLVKTKTEDIYQTFQIEGNSEIDILDVTDSLSQLIRNYLQIEVMSRDNEYKSYITTKNPEAYRYLLIGNKQFMARDWPSAIESFIKASEIDSSMIIQYSNMIAAYNNDGQPEKGRQVFNKLYQHIDDKDLSEVDRMTIYSRKARIDKNQAEFIRYSKLFIEQDPQLRISWYGLGWAYFNYLQYEKAIPAFEKVLELDRQYGVPLEWIATYTFLGRAYHKVGNHKREKEVYELGLKLEQAEDRIIYEQAICALSLGDTIEANEYLTKYFAIREEEGLTEAEKLNILGNIHRDADILEKAEKYYRKALELNPENRIFKNNLASLLIRNNIDIAEGLELINQVLVERPDYYSYLYTKSWGLYKEGKYEESLELLEKSWESRPAYSHQHYLDIQEVKQAIAKQKSEQ